jgi:hypothetical protein
MKKNQIIAKVKALNLPQSEYIVYGSCPLAAAGIRESNDIDLLVSRNVGIGLKLKGWKQITKGKMTNRM